MAKIRLPRSNPEIGYVNQARSTPNIVDTGQYIGSLLEGVSKSIGEMGAAKGRLDKYNEAEAEREDAILLKSDNWEGQLTSIREEIFDGTVYNEYGDIDHLSSIEKTQNIIDHWPDLLLKLEEDSIEVTNGLNLQSEAASKIALAGVSQIVSGLRLNKDKHIRKLQSSIDAFHTIYAGTKIQEAIAIVKEGGSSVELASAIDSANELLENKTITNPTAVAKMSEIIGVGRQQWLASYPNDAFGAEQMLTDFSNGVFDKDLVVRKLFIDNEYIKRLQQISTGISILDSEPGINNQIGSSLDPINPVLTSTVDSMLVNLQKQEQNPNILNEIRKTKNLIERGSSRSDRMRTLAGYFFIEDPKLWDQSQTILLANSTSGQGIYKDGDATTFDTHMKQLGAYENATEEDLYRLHQIITKLDYGIIPKNLEESLRNFMLRQTHDTTLGDTLFMNVARELEDSRYNLKLKEHGGKNVIDRIVSISHSMESRVYSTFEETVKATPDEVIASGEGNYLDVRYDLTYWDSSDKVRDRLLDDYPLPNITFREAGRYAIKTIGMGKTERRFIPGEISTKPAPEGWFPKADILKYKAEMGNIATKWYLNKQGQEDPDIKSTVAEQTQLADRARRHAIQSAGRVFLMDSPGDLSVESPLDISGRDFKDPLSGKLHGRGRYRLFHVPNLNNLIIKDPNGKVIPTGPNIPGVIMDAVSGADKVIGMENLDYEKSAEFLYGIVQPKQNDDGVTWRLVLPNGSEVTKTVDDRQYTVMIDSSNLRSWALTDDYIIKNKELTSSYLGDLKKSGGLAPRRPVERTPDFPRPDYRTDTIPDDVPIPAMSWDPSFMGGPKFKKQPPEEQIRIINKYMRNFSKDDPNAPWYPSEAFKGIEEYPAFDGLPMEKITRHIVANFRDRMNTDPFITGKVTSPIFLKHIRLTAQELMGADPEGKNLEELWDNNTHIPIALMAARREFLEEIEVLSPRDKKSFMDNIHKENTRFDPMEILHGDGTSGGLIRRELLKVQSGMTSDKDVTMEQIGTVAKTYLRTISERKGRDLDSKILSIGRTAPGSEDSPILELLGGTITNPGHYSNASIISRAIEPLDGSGAYPWVPIRELYKENEYKKIKKKDLVRSISLMQGEEGLWTPRGHLDIIVYKHFDFLRANAASLFTDQDQDLIFVMDDNRFSEFVWELVGKEVLPITAVDWPTNGR